MKGFVLKGIKRLLYPEFLEDVESLPLVLTEERISYFSKRLEEYLSNKNKVLREMCIEHLVKDLSYEFSRSTSPVEIDGLKKIEEIIRSYHH